MWLVYWYMQGDLDELGLDVGPRVAIANYLQTAKNKFKGTYFCSQDM